jgi:hypothetical protein
MELGSLLPCPQNPATGPYPESYESNPHCPHPIFQFYYNIYTKKLALTSPTCGCRSVGIVCSRTQATEFSSYFPLASVSS